MIFCDYHLHSDFSVDSRQPIQQYFEDAIEKGLTEICITDHVDFNDDGTMLQCDYTKYANYIRRLKDYQQQYQDKLTIKIGAEIGVEHQLKNIIDDFANNFSHDFIIASTHKASGKMLYMGCDFFSDDKYSSYYEFLQETLLNIQAFDFFNVYGHLDYITRYSNYEDKSLKYQDYQEILDEILTTLISKNKGLEINTSAIRYKNPELYPSLDILKRYKQLGGTIITIGSDSHIHTDLTRDFDLAQKHLKNAGFTQFCTFSNKQPNFFNI